MLRIYVDQRLSLFYEPCYKCIQCLHFFRCYANALSAFRTSSGHYCICIFGAVDVFLFLTLVSIMTRIAYIRRFLKSVACYRLVSWTYSSAVILTATAILLAFHVTAYVMHVCCPYIMAVFPMPVVSTDVCSVLLDLFCNRCRMSPQYLCDLSERVFSRQSNLYRHSVAQIHLSWCVVIIHTCSFPAGNDRYNTIHDHPVFCQFKLV